MIGANAIFHLGSLVAIIWALVVMMRWRADRELLRQLTVAKTSRTFLMMEPGKFLARMCRAMDLHYEAENSHGQLQKITWGPWRDFFSSQPISLVRWNDAGPSMTVYLKQALPDAGEWEARLKAALGDKVQVKVETVHE